MKRVVAALDGFWFAEAPATRLALLRILVGGYALAYLAARVSLLSSVAGTSRDLFDPVGVAAFLDAPIPVQTFRSVLMLTLAANVAFILGWQHRYSGPLFAGLLLWVLSYRNSWSMVYHSDNVLVLHVLILGLTPAADALSLDALKLGRFGGGGASVPVLGVWRARRPVGDWAYGYPIRLMCAVTVLSYFVSAVAKVVGPLGWAWMTGEALRSQLAVDALRKELLSGGAPDPVFALFENVALFTVVGAGTLVLELGAPAALLSKRLSWVWAVAAFLMHWGIYTVMEIRFEYHLSGVIFASFFDLERIAAWLDPRRIRGRLARAPSGLGAGQPGSSPPAVAS